MKPLLTTILVGISLSMDAFSLSLAYGTINLNKSQKLILSLIVGVYHFIMPLIGLFFGGVIEKYIIINFNILVALIFVLIGVNLIMSSFKEEKTTFLLGIVGYLTFGLSVSLDSLTTGIGLNAINNNYIQVSTIFAITSFTFTYLGLKLGNIISEKFGHYATILGGSLLIILGIYYLI